MTVTALLSDKREVILKRWNDVLIEAYHEDAAGYIRRRNGQFANPVGYAYSEGLEGIYNELLLDLDEERVSEYIDRIIRIRAVQSFAPSQAVSFIFSLKRITREEIEEAFEGQEIGEDILSLDLKFDTLALIAFDIFMKCREKLFEIKANEARDMTFRLLQGAKSATLQE